MSSGGSVVLNFGDSLIRSSDFRLLDGNGWFNDILIGFYFEYLEGTFQINGIQIKFYHPDVTHWVKMCSSEDVSSGIGQVDQYDFLFFPVNDCVNKTSAGGSHWSLLVYSKADHEFAHFDSSSRMNGEEAEKLYKRIRGCIDKEGNFSKKECISQSNSYDCGPHVLCNTKKICEFIKTAQDNKNQDKCSLGGFKEEDSATPNDAKEMRKYLSDLITRLAK